MSEATPSTDRTMLAVEYVPSPDNALEVRRFYHRRGMRYPPLVMAVCGGLTLAAGGAMMGAAGSSVWFVPAFCGLVFAATPALLYLRDGPSAAKTEAEFASRPWLRTPFRFEADGAGVRYAHGPFSVRADWNAFARVAETDGALVLVEKPAAGALLYGLPKRQLERTPGGVKAWRELFQFRLT